MRYPKASATLQRNVERIASTPQPAIDDLAHRFIDVAGSPPSRPVLARPSPGLVAILENANLATTGSSRSASASVDSPEALGRQVRFARQGLDWAQHRLADEAGVGRRFVSELEAGKPTAEIAKVFAVLRALGLSLSMGSGSGG